MKSLLRLFLSLSFLLISGYGNNADSGKDNIFLSSTHTLPTDHSVLNYLSEGTTHVVRYSPLPLRKARFGICATENEDENDRLSFSKKAIEAPNYFSAFYAKISCYVGHSIKQSLCYCVHLVYFPSFRYILFRVIRI